MADQNVPSLMRRIKGLLGARAVTKPQEAPRSPQHNPLIQRGVHDNFYLQRLRVKDIPKRLPYIRDLCSGRRVLHVGCTDYPVFNPDLNLHIQISDECATLDGLDTDVAGMEVLAGYVPGRYYRTPSEVKIAYDLLLVPETIEHVHNIQEFLNALNGIDFKEILITAPCLIGWNACFNYVDCLGWRHASLCGPDDYVEEIHPDHKAWFTPYTLANCVEQFTPWDIQQISFLEAKRMVCVHALKR